ncbi:MAG: AarF/ABC1/UbiB kinase family protein [Myxococcales bacterium]|nr:AarF/ABC1/UbiB kinase family protein [Myxococcales bacterium]
MLREAFYDLNRMRRILQIAVRYGFGDLLARARVFERLRLKQPATETTESSSPAQRLTRMLAELGPTFVKLGQILSTRPDLLPAEYIAALSELQDRAPAMPFSEVRKVLRQDLGAEPEDLFARFEEEPLAAASIAQVHRATLKDGREAAVKVRRPDIERVVRADLDILYTLAHLLQSAPEEEAALVDGVGLVREFDRAIARELDLGREAETLKTFFKNFEKRASLSIPEPVEPLCGPRVLTMSLLCGQRISEIPPGSELAQKAAANLIEGAYQQIFEDGLFHSDPHPGNLCVLADGRVGMMDFGQVGRLTPAMRNTLALLALGVVLRDPDTLARLVYRVGASGRRVDLGELRQDIQQMLDGNIEKALGEVDTGKVLQRLLLLAQRYRVALPAEYALVAKAVATVEAAVRALHPGLVPATATAPYVRRLLADRYNLEDLRGGMARTLLQLSSFLSELPQQASQILLDLEGGRLTVNVRDPEAGKRLRVLRYVGLEVFWGLIAAGLLAGSLPAFFGERPAPWIAVLGIAGATAIALCGTAIHFIGPLLRRMSLRRWLERRFGDRE